MEKTIFGNTEGIKKNILSRLEGMYDMTVDQGQLISHELALMLRDLSAAIGREVSIYVDRKGHVINVAVGSDSNVTLPDTGSRKSRWRLSGISCIHTHPSGAARLSGVDISALKSLRYDAMAALAWASPEAEPLLSFGMITEFSETQEPRVQEFGPYTAKEASRLPFGRIVAAVEKILAKMTRSEETHEGKERAMLISMSWGDTKSRWSAEDSVEELAELAKTAGAEVVGRFVQTRPKPDPVYFIGRGKVHEMSLFAQQEDIDLCIFDDELSPAQQRNLEQALGVRIVDRTGLILDIFAQRARTSEGKLQVELAQLQYELPRIMGQGMVLSRLGGGIGTRGPGETKLEVDRRRIRDRISFLEEQIRKMKLARKTQQRSRLKNEIPQICLVGYTNAGKSSLLNTLTDSDIYTQDQLFATLDPTTRQLTLPDKEICTLTDTVGFIQRLPHQLVAAFKSTLEVVKDADLLLHVVDCSNEMYHEQEIAVYDVLHELGVENKRILTVYNKIDKLPEHAALPSHLEKENTVAISAKTGEGIPQLLKAIENILNEDKKEVTLLIPYTDTKTAAALHSDATVLEETYEANGVRMKVRMDKARAEKVRAYLVNE
jgi:GTP-binding protein HflX